MRTKKLNDLKNKKLSLIAESHNINKKKQIMNHLKKKTK